MKKSGLALIILLLAVLAFGGVLFLIPRKVLPQVQVVIVYDVSLSTPFDWTCMEGVIREEYSKNDTFELTTFATGDRTTAFEPVLISSDTITKTGEWVQGPDAPDSHLRELLSGIKAKWERVHPTDTTPIYLGIQRGVQYALNKATGNNAVRKVYVKSDMQETAYPQIKEALAGKRTKLPRPIDNDGVEVQLLGMAETRGEEASSSGKRRSLTAARTPQQIETLDKVWYALFNNPRLVKFDGYCGKAIEMP